MTKVITYGTFDLFHEGHYKLLQRAKALGDYLIVGVTTEHFDEARGKVNVIDPILERIENVRKTGFADEIIVEDHVGQKIEDIQKYGIDIFTVGSDWVGTFDYLNQFCKVIYLERTPNVSSTIIRKNRFQIVRMGIIGTGRIAPRFVSEAKYVSGIEVESAYNPDKNNASYFTKRTDIEVRTDDFAGFLNGVDAVYIASPNETHYDYAKKALESGKHVLSEKPLAFTKAQTKELYDLASRNKLVLLEGIKTAYCPGFQQMMNVAMSGRIGEIKDVEACFTRLADESSRERTDAEYGGSFLEFGGYTLLPVVKLLGMNYKDIRIDSITGDNGIDLYTKIQIIYENAMATSKDGVGVKSEGQLVISGTKGYILAPSPWWLTKKFEVRYENAGKIETYEPTFQGDGLRYEISDFVMKINGISKNGYKLTAEESIAMSGITEMFMEKRQKNRMQKLKR
jgi:glycerol-3-phosphate cytidylyltransferase